jgi:hypothetical protein
MTFSGVFQDKRAFDCFYQNHVIGTRSTRELCTFAMQNGYA